MIGKTVSHYRITEKLGEGGMGVVYKAEDVKLDRPVALKFLAAHLLESEEARRRFLREAKAAAALDHPNVCTVYEVDESDGAIFIAMAFLEGRTLNELISARPLTIEKALDIAMQAAEGLESAHQKSIVHRDIKPANLMVIDGSSRPLLKIMDFGLARLSGASKLTQNTTSMGTAAYMSPEQTSGADVDARADIWALGVVLYEAITGQLPFKGHYSQAVLYSILNEQPEPMTSLRSGVPVELERIVNKCLAKETGERYQNAGDLNVDLRALRRRMESEQSGETRKHAGLPAASAPAPNRRWMIGLGAIVVLALAGLAWWRLANSGSANSTPLYRLTQLTRDEGLTYEPALSPDGKLVAYASNRSGNMDIWVQQTAGGVPLQLTRHPSEDNSPSFSPDGSSIVFSSSRDGGGVYTISSLGGNERLLAKEGFDPSYSPDGNSIVYYTSDRTTLMNSRLYVVPSVGGTSREIPVPLRQLGSPRWAPDGRHIVVIASETADTTVGPRDWFAIPVQGGEPIKIDLAEAGPGQIGMVWGWLSNGRDMILTSRRIDLTPGAPAPGGGGNLDAGGTVNIWKVPFSLSAWKATGRPARLTAGTGEYEPSVSNDGRIAFSTASESRPVWFLPLDPNKGRVTGEIRRITQGATLEAFPTVSADGKKLVYASDRGGSSDVWLRDLETGEERPLVASSAVERRGIISPDGTKVLFQRVESGKFVAYLSPLNGGSERVICEDCRSLLNWTRDGERVLIGDGNPEKMSTLNLATGEKTTLAEHPDYQVHDAVFSPDERWVAFKIVKSASEQPLFIAPIRNGSAVPQSEWIPITQDVFTAKSWWSPDGNLIYFYGRIEATGCLWAQRLDPRSKRPVGEPFAVQHFHGERTVQPGGADTGYGQTGDGVYLPLVEQRGNIWLAEPQESGGS